MRRLLNTNKPLKRKLVFFTAIKCVLLGPFKDDIADFPTLSYAQSLSGGALIRLLIVCFKRTHAKVKMTIMMMI